MAPRLATVTSYPVKLYEPSMGDEISKTPFSLSGLWFHATTVKEQIWSGGWKPQLNKNSIYGTAVYLARKKWDLGDRSLCDSLGTVAYDADAIKIGLRDTTMFTCVLALQDHEVQSRFSSQEESEDCTENDLINYLNRNVPVDTSKPQGLRRVSDVDGLSTRLQFSRNGGPGHNTQNQRIAEYFRSNGIRAIRFREHDMEVAAIFDPSCIRVLPETTNLDLAPFQGMLSVSCNSK
jgi:hypothetical protein